MEHIGKNQKLKRTAAKNRFLHSKNHLLADELSQKLSDSKHFGFYLKMAILYNHGFLRKLADEVLESKSVKTPGKVFAFLIKKRNQDRTYAFGQVRLEQDWNESSPFKR